MIGVIDCVGFFIVRFNIAVESHPTLLVYGPYVYEPPALTICVPHVYGSSVGHIDISAVLVLVALTLKVSVAALSQPATFVK